MNPELEICLSWKEFYYSITKRRRLLTPFSGPEMVMSILHVDTY